MKKIAIMLLACLVVSAAPCRAAELEPPASPLRKLQRGFLNIALSPLELAHWLSLQKTEDSFIPTWMTNAGKGTVFTAGRILTGAYEIVTFPIPFPANYEPVVYPEFTWEHFDSCSDELGKC